MNQPAYTIAQTAQKLKLHPKTLRRWEKQGWFKASRTKGGQRRYTRQDIAKLKNLKAKKPQSIPPPEQKPALSTSSQPSRPVNSFLAPAVIISLLLSVATAGYLYLKKPGQIVAPAVKQLDIAPDVKVALPQVASFLDGRIGIGTDTGDLSFLDQKGNLYVKNAALIGQVHTNSLTLLPSAAPDAQIGRQYVNQDNGDLLYFDGSDWVTLNKTASNSAWPHSLVVEDQDIDITLGNSVATSSAVSLNLTLAGPQSLFSILGGAGQSIITFNDDADYPVNIAQPTKIAANLHTAKLIDTDDSSYFLDLSATDTSLKLAGNATINNTLTFSQNSESISNDTDGYLTISAGLGVIGGTKYGFDTDADLTAHRGQFTSTLVLDGTLDANGELELGDGDDLVTISATNLSLTSNSSGNDITLKSADQIILQASADTSDYIYLSTSSDAAGLFFEGYTTNDPAIRINASTNEIEYRDENETTWTSFDSGMATGWTDGGTDVYLTTSSDRVGIGTTNPSSKLEVVGDIRVTNGSFIDDGTTLNVPDYVFEENYDLLSPIQLSEFIRLNRHLPGVPSREEINQQGMNLSNLILNILEKTEENVLYILDLYQKNQTSFLAPTVETEVLTTNFISPLADGEGIVTVTGPMVIEENLAVKGNASVAGDLIADRVVTEELIASKIKVSTIEGLKQKIAGLVNSYQEQTATASADIADDLLAQYLDQLEQLEISHYEASSSASYLSLNSIEAETAFFKDYLAVMGKATITDLSVSNSLSVNNNLVLGSNSIASLADTLYLQPSGQGSINLLAGLMVLDGSGNVAVKGDLRVSGALIASEISPPFEQMLNIRIASQSALSIYNQIAGQPVASIDASGSASFARLNLKAAGTAVIPAGENHVTISTTALTASSQVIITFGSSYAPATKYWVSKQTDQRQFTVYVNYPVNYRTAIDWLIIN